MSDPENGVAESPLDASVQFQGFRDVLPAAHRVTWRISLLALTLGKFRGSAASLGTLHLFMWASQSSLARTLLVAWLTGVRAPDVVTSRIDPGLETTVRLAIAEGLAVLTGSGRVELTERGKELAALIDASEGLMAVEKDMLRQVAPLNDNSIRTRMGGALHVD